MRPHVGSRGQPVDGSLIPHQIGRRCIRGHAIRNRPLLRNLLRCELLVKVDLRRVNLLGGLLRQTRQFSQFGKGISRRISADIGCQRRCNNAESNQNADEPSTQRARQDRQHR